MRTLGITLARGGSRGVKDKNIREVGGKPLLAWTIEQALGAALVDEYVVSTDSDRIAAVARRYGAKVIMRPDELATDESPSIGALVHALDACEKVYDTEYTAVADIRNTNPLKRPSDIDNCVRMLLRTGADTVCGIERVVEYHPSRLKQMMGGNRLADVWPELSGNRQDLRPPVYVRNGSIYVTRSTALREGIHFMGGDIRGYLMDRGVNIDTEFDLAVADMLLRQE